MSVRVDPRRLARHLRYATLALAAAGVWYLFHRFELTTLPSAGCSPIARFAPGDRLLLDRRPPAWHVGDVALYERAGAAGAPSMHFGVVRRTRAGDGGVELWVETEVPDCPGPDSDEFGWIPSGALRARLVLVLP